MEKNNSKSKILKSGSYSAAITVFVVAFIVVINLIVNALPVQYTKFDFTEQQMYTLSEQTKTVLKDLEDDITVYVIAQKENEDPGLLSVLEKYQALSDKLEVVVKDPAVYPTFTAEYTEDVLADNSVIVVSDKRHCVVPVADMYELAYNSTTGEYAIDSFVGEDVITSAIDYVITDKLPKMYVITGHGEQAIGAFASEIQRENISVETLPLAQSGQIPDDADCVLMEAPTDDISEMEAEVLSKYLDKGGKLFYISYVAKNETPNLDRVLKEYGIEVADGFVCEGKAGNYYDYITYLSPVYGEHDIVAPLAENQVQMMLVNAQHVAVLDNKPADVEVTPLLRTSSSAYVKQVGSSNPEKEAGDLGGVMNLAVAVEKGETQIIVATTYDLFSEETNIQVAGGNYDFLLNSIGYLCEHDSLISIRGKQLYSDSLTVTSGHTMLWIFALMIILPMVCLITGLVFWVKRRKR